MNIEDSIKILEKFTTEHKLFNIKHSDGLEEAIETLLTAYEKEKEKNKKLRDKAKELIFEKQELTSALLDSTPNDKIKAKIEELENDPNNIEEHNCLRADTCYVINILQSLLEKE